MTKVHQGFNRNSRSVDNEDMIDEFAGLIEECERILQVELSLIESRLVDELPAIASQKNAVLSALADRETQLIDLLIAYPAHPRVIELKHRLRACQELNRKNQAVVTLELRHTRKSLELLRSLLKMDDLPLYGAGGQITVAREKRDFGSA